MWWYLKIAAEVVGMLVVAAVCIVVFVGVFGFVLIDLLGIVPGSASASVVVFMLATYVLLIKAVAVIARAVDAAREYWETR